MPEPTGPVDPEEIADSPQPLLRFRYFESVNGTRSRPIAPPSRQKVLRQHFFRRFFDNDTLSVESETQTSIIRALTLFAVPGLMTAFWLQPSYPGVPARSVAAILSDRYFFVLYAFVAMGAITAFEWDMLFPDRADFLILLPLPLKASELFYAKGRALLSFLGLFLVASNVFATILYPGLSTTREQYYVHTLAVHALAVFSAGIFAAFSMLAIKGLSIALLPDRWLRWSSPLLQCVAMAGLVLLMLLFPMVGGHLQALLGSNAVLARCFPPLWFLGLYEQLNDPATAPDASSALASTALSATVIVVIIALAAYPLAWTRQRKRAIEGASSIQRAPSSLLQKLLHRTLLRQPQQRGVFHFLSQTITRNIRYQSYMAAYAGVGLAMAFTCILTFKTTQNPAHSPADTLRISLDNTGLHALIPLLLFWLVAGLKTAFAFPVDMLARWVFPINLPPTSPFALPAAKTAKTWVRLGGLLLTIVLLTFLLALHWSYWSLAIQALWGAGLTLLVPDLFFLGRTQIPFTRPRSPGRANLPLALVTYIVLFPLFVVATVQAELYAELHPVALAWTAITMVGLHLILHAVDILAQRGIIGGQADEDDLDDGPQTLGLHTSALR